MAFTLSFTLKQHTPLIHFQHDQAGATLRATEVKPKLDRFIIEKLGGWEKIPVEWRVGKQKSQHPALDYKLKVAHGAIRHEPIEIPYTNHKGKEVELSFPAFFANMGEENKGSSKWFSFAETDLNATIWATNEKLIVKIRAFLAEFFALHNFGTRQSKGFGSFYLSELEKNPIKPFFKYSFVIDADKIVLPAYSSNPLKFRQQAYKSTLSQYTRFFKLFYSVNLLYSTLRSGINHSGIYFKSLMFMYAKSQTPPIIWDKKLIRYKFQHFTGSYKEIQADPNRKDPNGTFLYPPSNKGHEQRLMRDMLGLSTEQAWLSYRDTITKEHSEIGRFKSPIRFKIIHLENGRFRVFIHTEPIPDYYFGKSFTIKSKNYRPQRDEPAFTLQTPLKPTSSKTEFQLDDFLDFSFKRLFPTETDFREHFTINDLKNSDSIVKPLVEIFNQLRNC